MPVQRISRVRTGCLKCRVRKKKCDETRPACRACERNNFVCTWPSRASTTPQPLRDDRDATTAESPRREPTLPPSGIPVSSSCMRSANGSRTPSFQQESETNARLGQDEHITVGYDSLTTLVPQSSAMPDAVGIPTSPAWRPAADSELVHHKAALLEYYLCRTAESMSNGFQPTNPFITQVIPAALCSDVILHLVLAQSAAHRAAQSGNAGNEVAIPLYSSSIKRFQNYIDKYVADPETDVLPLALGTLIMCYTETARGDVNGIIFDHLLACPALLIHCLSKVPAGALGTLPDFLVEYYFYTASVSMISIDADLGPSGIINEQLEDRAQMLVSANYAGNLCGCWLEILLILPRIFNLGRQLRQDGPSTATMALYATLQRQLLEWCPPVPLDSHAGAVACAYRFAALLYLYTAVELPRPGLFDDHNVLVQTTVDQSLEALSLLPLSDRINTAMCWPLAVIGSCLFDEGQQALIQTRLEAMSAVIGLGNMEKTLLILRHIWDSPTPDEVAGPWNISKVMQMHQIWISFA